MDRLADEAWQCHLRAQSHPCLVKPSLPILCFGDLDAYESSPVRVVTVALNPSRKEFPASNPFERFPKASGLRSNTAAESDFIKYISALTEYFRVAPYRSWFGWFEELLIGMGASYYPGQDNTALHTDLCSPLATDPTWSGLETEQSFFEFDGIPLWHKLIEQLSPDVIIFSIARRYLDRVTILDQSKWKVIHTVIRSDPEKRPYVVQAQVEEKSRLIVFGQAAQQPFATLTKQARREIGRSVHAELSRRIIWSVL